MEHAFKKGKAYICQNPSCQKKFYKYGYGTSSTIRYVYAKSEAELNARLDYIEVRGNGADMKRLRNIAGLVNGAKK